MLAGRLRSGSAACARGAAGRRTARGFTLLELALTMIVVGVLAAVGVNSYSAYIKRARNTAAISDIGKIQIAVDRYAINHDSVLPPDLATVGMGAMRDPWGNAYIYLRFAGLTGKGAMRKDKNLVPINTDYDLYSMGPDGLSVPPLTAAASQDDIVRANDGGFVGRASDY